MFDDKMKHNWVCGQCGKLITSWTEHGLDLLSRAHKLDHSIPDLKQPEVRDRITTDDLRFLKQLKIRWF